jgi:hypothetical protein
MTETTEHLNLRGWPFNVVPSEETAAVWVGREAARRRLLALIRSIGRIDASQIVLLWAPYGSGKTHALRHLQWLAHDRANLLPLYVVTPKGIRSFLDIYRAIIDAAISTGAVAAAGQDLFRRVGMEGGTDVERALVRIGTLPADMARTAIDWLKADKVPMKELKDIGIARRLEGTSDGIEALNELIQILQRDGAVKLLLLLDEIQELAEIKGARLDEARGGLHKVFDRNPQGLTMVLSFTTATQVAVSRIIGETLFDRRSEILSLPPIETAEAVELITGLVRAWSTDEDRAPYPFTEEAIEAGVAEIAKRNRQLTPRAVIRGFAHVLREADLDLEDSVISVADADYVRDKLSSSSDPDDVAD